MDSSATTALAVAGLIPAPRSDTALIVWDAALACSCLADAAAASKASRTMRATVLALIARLARRAGTPTAASTSDHETGVPGTPPSPKGGDDRVGPPTHPAILDVRAAAVLSAVAKLVPGSFVADPTTYGTVVRGLLTHIQAGRLQRSQNPLRLPWERQAGYRISHELALLQKLLALGVSSAGQSLCDRELAADVIDTITSFEVYHSVWSEHCCRSLYSALEMDALAKPPPGGPNADSAQALNEPRAIAICKTLSRCSHASVKWIKRDAVVRLALRLCDAARMESPCREDLVSLLPILHWMIFNADALGQIANKAPQQFEDFCKLVLEVMDLTQLRRRHWALMAVLYQGAGRIPQDFDSAMQIVSESLPVYWNKKQNMPVTDALTAILGLLYRREEEQHYQTDAEPKITPDFSVSFWVRVFNWFVWAGSSNAEGACDVVFKILIPHIANPDQVVGVWTSAARAIAEAASCESDSGDVSSTIITGCAALTVILCEAVSNSDFAVSLASFRDHPTLSARDVLESLKRRLTVDDCSADEQLRIMGFLRTVAMVTPAEPLLSPSDMDPIINWIIATAKIELTDALADVSPLLDSMQLTRCFLQLLKVARSAQPEQNMEGPIFTAAALGALASRRTDVKSVQAVFPDHFVQVWEAVLNVIASLHEHEGSEYLDQALGRIVSAIDHAAELEDILAGVSYFQPSKAQDGEGPTSQIYRGQSAFARCSALKHIASDNRDGVITERLALRLFDHLQQQMPTSGDDDADGSVETDLEIAEAAKSLFDNHLSRLDLGTFIHNVLVPAYQAQLAATTPASIVDSFRQQVIETCTAERVRLAVSCCGTMLVKSDRLDADLALLREQLSAELVARTVDKTLSKLVGVDDIPKESVCHLLRTAGIIGHDVTVPVTAVCGLAASAGNLAKSGWTDRGTALFEPALPLELLLALDRTDLSDMTTPHTNLLVWAAVELKAARAQGSLALPALLDDLSTALVRHAVAIALFCWNGAFPQNFHMRIAPRAKELAAVLDSLEPPEFARFLRAAAVAVDDGFPRGSRGNGDDCGAVMQLRALLSAATAAAAAAAPLTVDALSGATAALSTAAAEAQAARGDGVVATVAAAAAADVCALFLYAAAPRLSDGALVAAWDCARWIEQAQFAYDDEFAAVWMARFLPLVRINRLL
ncbi:hypothetical protein DFJ73DRAFT_798603 [Zopfochytrium polystomum]|nr:hypothetical protein DFJ73DRAFT_798603 [Zopfochytrium polystomum]